MKCFRAAGPVLASACLLAAAAVGATPPPSCGDGVRNNGEQCDDGNAVDWDGCDADCRTTLELRVDRAPGSSAAALSWTGGFPRFAVQRSTDPVAAALATSRVGDTAGRTWNDAEVPLPGVAFHYLIVSLCGNGTRDPGEECDDGNNYDLDGCRAGCFLERCGDGVLDAGEECDDGNLTSGDGCQADCRDPYCGDGVLDPGESCDDGPANDLDACGNDCLPNYCGDGQTNNGEECDDANADDLDACGGDCRLNFCGDGEVNLAEACDTGAANSDTAPDACRTDCTPAACGDGVVDAGETCDGGAGNSDTAPNACRTDCTPAACGDGVVDAGETCDGGAGNSDTAPNACRTDCTPAACGDGVVDAGETCDGGAANSDTAPDACRTDCTPAACGDGVVDAGETCDEGAGNSDTAPDACRTDCTPAACGDGVVDTGEACDTGARNSDVVPNACRTDCASAACGDGVVDAGETCDTGGANSDTAPNACRTDCTPAACGDGVVDAGEACDAGGANSDTAPNACRTDCTPAACGDGVVDAGEACDAGVANSDTAPNACRTDCTPAACGDGVVDAGETCDTGGANSDTAPNACRTDCTPAACGDGVVDAGETCDAGGANSDTAPNACRTDCTPAACGDGVVDAGEACDAGVANSDTAPNACRTDCTPAACGDGVVDAGETCDTGAANSDTQPNRCRTDCVPAGCGDGVVDAGEACDTGAANSDTLPNRCRTDCVPAGCGDGVIDAGESCDDGNQVGGDGCSADCAQALCGNGAPDPGEQCDDGVANSDTAADACRTDCTTAACGDAVVDTGEQCDAGAANSDTGPSACRTDCTRGWHGAARRYRVKLQAGANGFARLDKVVEAELNLQALLSAAGGTGTVHRSSLELVEVTGAGVLVDGSVPFQFDGTTASTLVWVLEGDTPAGATRYYHLYFDTLPGVAPSFADRVVVTDGVPDAGQSSFRVATGTGTYYFQKEAAGFSSLIDSRGNDWIGFSAVAGSGSGGEFRGVPNLAFPANIYHPGFVSASSSLAHDGPLKATIDSPSDNGQFRTRWEFYPDYAKLTVLQATGSYWFLYEGTPGGVLDRNAPNNDFLVRSDGTQYSVAASWGAGQDIPGDEWVYFADPAQGRALFLAHHTNDAVVDWYEPLDLPAGGPAQDWMTVFGFGRGTGATSHLTGAPRQFTLGLLETTEFSAARSAIRAAYKDVALQVGVAERLAAGCGDGQVGAGEECDDGNTDAGDGCGPGCVLEYACGDGQLNDGEQCDDGDAQNGDGCDANCVLETCGNGVVQAGEACDDGNTNDLDGCGNDCRANVCGDGAVNNGEACDLGAANSNAPNATCRTNCTLRRCGDAIVDTGEACDDGNASSSDTCLADCRIATCGDGFVRQGVEPCDDGNASNSDGCRVGCIAATCGDGIVRTGVETCDDGNVVDGDACTATCRANVIRNGTFAGGTAQWSFNTDGSGSFAVVSGELRVAITTAGTNVQLYQINVPVAGAKNYVLRFRGRSSGGQDLWIRLHKHTTPYGSYGLNARIDLTTANQTFAVPFTTTAGDKTDGRFVFWLGDYDQNGASFYFDDVVLELAGRCGDAIVDAGEQCDDGNLVGGDGCQATCLSPACGDGAVDPGEQCDDGNPVSGDGCQANCLDARCGDGVLDPGEECDDGNVLDGDLCRSNCTDTCGDGVVDPGEECDLGPANGDGPGGVCRTDCRLAGCGDGILGTTEACDDGNVEPYDGCSPACAIETAVCGNGFREQGEECDDGNSFTGDGCEPECVALAPTLFRQPRPGEIYKEFTRVMAGAADWRVTDPDATYVGEPGNEPAAFLPNPQLPLTIDDLDGALRAEVLIDAWGGHVGTTLKRLRVNGHPHIAIPELNTTPTPGQCYTQQWNVVVDVPLSDLVEGSNLFEGTTGAQTCYSFGWGQFGWYSITVRVYYGPDKPHPTGAITSPIDGATIGEAPTISAAAQGAAGIRKVEFLAYHEGVDTDGDGRYLDWQGAYHRAPADPTAAISRHVGTDSAAPYLVAWDTTLVPDQVPGRIRLLARIQDHDGVWFVTDEVTGLTLARPYVVRMYKPQNVPEDFWVRAGETKSATLTIPPAHDLGAAVSARLVMRTWNGIDGAAEPGQLHSTTLNLWAAPNYGANHYYSLDVLGVPVSALQSGANTVSVQSDSTHHGIEVLWPGPQLVVRYTTPSGACGDGGPDAGEACDDGNVANGDGCNALCQLETCGDGVIQAGLGEQCDDGNAALGDGCDAACRFEGCGNAVVDPGEQCDDGNIVDGDGCSATCTLETPCGNGTLDAGELCDDGNTLGGDGCSPTCRRLVSDDFNTQPLDPGLWTTTDPVGDATFALTGAGTADARLEISVPAGTGHDAWTPQNLAPRAMQSVDDSDFDVAIKLDSRVQQANQFQGLLVEQDADDWIRFDVYSNGSAYYGLAARIAGAAATVHANPALGSGPSPPTMLLRVTRSGDQWRFRYSLDGGAGWADVGSAFNSALEVRRLGVMAGNAAGNPAFTARFDWFFDLLAPIVPEDPVTCGNGALDLGEECDQGAANSNAPGAACRADCTLGGCGDGILDPGEDCDDGNMTSGDGCQATCLDPACGDGFVDPGEECDDDNVVGGDGCDAACQLEPGCGDGALDPGEICDDGNTTSGDGCSNTCKKIVSDDFHAPVLGAFWTPIDPLGGTTFSLTGTGTANARLEIAVPGGTAHDYWTTNDSPRLMQGADDSNFTVETKLESAALQGNAQFQGVLVEQDPTHWVRLSAVSNGVNCVAFVSARNGGTPTNPRSATIGALPCPNPLYLRLERVAPNWTARYSLDATNWTSVGTSYSYALAVQAVGVLAGNSVSSPALTARFDWFFDTAAPVVPEDPITCGNGAPDPGEECDQGAGNSNSVPDACRLDCTVPGCGDGVTDTGEQCDDGNLVSGDGCQTGCLLPVCGDGILDAGEACDQGAANSDTTPGACRTSCDLAGCGDGVTDPGEQCDDGPGNSNLPGAHCRTACTLARCGDGIEDPGEQCDLGAANSNLADAACRTDCRDAGCGDGIEDTGETCDDGNTASGDGCSAGCLLESDCGNGALDPGELCDDGNTLSGDGCSNSCKKLISDDFSDPTLAAFWTPVDPLGGATFGLTGTGTANARLAIGVPGGTAHDYWTTNDSPRLMQGADNSNFTVETKLESVALQGNAQFQGILVEQDATHWLRLSAVTNGTQCVAFVSVRNGGAPSNPRSATIGAVPCPNPLYLRLVRTGSTWSGWYSPDGTSFTNVGASYGLTLAVQAVGVLAGNAGTNTAFTARFDYFFEAGSPVVPEDPNTCGNGIPDPGEACDAGAANSDTTPDACRTDCTLPGCGDGVTDTGEGCDDGNAVSGDGCQAGCVLPVCGDGILDPGESCDAGAANSDTAPGACRTSCEAAGCGDGVTDPAEQCDDGVANSNTSGAHCRTDCDLAGCGDAIVDPGEQCDLGLSNSNLPDAPCRTDCGLAGCGDGIEDTGEACDDGNTANGDGCSAACALESSCGNGTNDPGELCDDGNTLSGDGCSSTCKKIVSDDFSAASLDPGVWTTVNPLGDATISLTGTGTANARLEIAVPGGTGHDASSTNLAPRVTQGADNSNFDVQIKLESVVSAGNQFQGLLVEQDADDWIRFDVFSDGTQHRGFIARNAGGSMTAVQSVAIGAGPSPAVMYLRVSRVGNAWTFRRSLDGTSWTQVGTSFNSTLVVHAVGVQAGNGVGNPAHTARFDWFFDTAAPIVLEDPGACGDGVLGPGEECDEGGANSDAPGAVCRLDCTLADCGDGVVDPGEGCDAGALNSNAPGAPCRADCTPAGCGDGIVDLVEQCDLGAGNSDLPGAVCRTDCSLAGCGDGIVDPGETCDAGAANSEDPGATCRTDCTDAGCGDGIVDPGEGCDDGAANSDAFPDACRTDCTLAGCGDAVVDAGETCDDGGTVGGDGCSAVCKRLVSDDFSAGSIDPGVWTTIDPLGGTTFSVTGSGTANARLQIAVPSGTAHDFWTSNDAPRVMQGADNSNFAVETKLESAAMQTNAQFQGLLVEQDATHWLRLSAVASGASCSAVVSQRSGAGSPTNVPGVTIGAGACPSPLYLRLERAGTSWTARYSLNGSSWTNVGSSATQTLVVQAVGVLAGNAGTNPAFTARFDYVFDVAAPIVPEDTVTCGNSALDPDEECDDGAANSDSVPDACRTNCTAAGCGDAVVDTGEACDLGLGNSEAPNATCRTDCALAGCGDGVEDTGETCDDGNLAGGDGCSATCQLETSCGNGALDAGEVCDDGNTLSGDGCSQTCKRIVSDDFDAAALGAVWTPYPLGGATLSMTGTGTADARLEIAVPGGSSHDAWGTNNAPRAMQAADDSDFELEIKLESVVSAGNHFQGILVEQDADDWLRFDIYSDGSSWSALAARTVAGATTAVRNVALGAAPSPALVYLRVKRTGDTWLFRYSLDGTIWTNVGNTFSHALDVHAVGVQAGNGVGNPALTARFDYFFDVLGPPFGPEDGP